MNALRRSPSHGSVRRALAATALVVLFLPPLPSLARTSDDAGTSAGATLRQARTARMAALGGASAAVDYGVEGVWGNPATLISMDRREVSLSRVQSFADITLNMMAVGMRIGRRHAVGLSYTAIGYGTIEGRDATGRSIGQVRAGDDVGSLCYAFRPADSVSVGLTGRWVGQRLGTDGAHTLTSDLGIAWHTPFTGLTLGAAVQNLGGSLTFVRESFPLPRTWRVGVSQALFGGRFLAVADAVKPRDAGWEAAFGLEAHGASFFALRSGGIVRGDRSFEYTAGLGVQLKGISFDYAWTPRSGGVDNQQRFSLGVEY